jgi:superoxide dismutase, Fe-Mn family
MGTVPIMVLDAWEHAWYLQYLNDKAKFFEATWNLWNWDDIGPRLAQAKKLDLGLVKASDGQ